MLGADDKEQSSAVDGARLWVTGLWTALLAAAAGAVTFLIGEELLDLELLRRAGIDSNEPVSLELVVVVVVAVWATVCATALLHLLLLTTSRAVTVFVWTSIVALALSFVPIFAVDADADVKIMQGVLHIVVALPIITILTRVGNRLAVPTSEAESAVVLTRQEPQSEPAQNGATSLIVTGFGLGDGHGQRLADDDDQLDAQGVHIVEVDGMEQFPRAISSDQFRPGRHLLLIPDRSRDDAIGVWDAIPSRQIGWLPPETARRVSASLESEDDNQRATSLRESRADDTRRVGLTIAIGPEYLAEAEAEPTTPTWAWVALTALTVIVGAVGVLVINTLEDRPDPDDIELIDELNDDVAATNENLETTTDLLGEILAGIESMGGTDG